MELSKILTPLTVLLCLSLTSYDLCSDGTNPTNEFLQKHSNVILITLDGVRTNEFFDKTGPFKLFWDKYANEGVVYGDKSSQNHMYNASVPISLPSYQAIMSGRVQENCTGNDCGQIKQQTMFEYIKTQLAIPYSKAATIASWNNICHSIERVVNTTYSNCGFYDYEIPVPNPTYDQIEFAKKYNLYRSKELEKSIWVLHENSKSDFFTKRLALHYITKFKPRLMFISLGDMDVHAHHGERQNYEYSLKVSAQFIESLFNRLNLFGNYGKHTTVIITTDHGRGIGDNWESHGSKIPYANHIWMYAKGPWTASGGIVGGFQHHTHLDIRPTIETLMGVTPSMSGPGKVFNEVVDKIKKNKL